VTITAVGSLQSVGSFGADQITITTQTPGNVLLVAVQLNYSKARVVSLSGGNVDDWERLAGPFAGYAGDLEIWWGKVTGTGDDVLYATLTGFDSNQSQSATYNELNVQEFTAGLGPNTVWTKDVEGGRNNTSSSTTVNYPALTPASAGELYFAHSYGIYEAQPGTTPGVTYAIDASGDMNLWANPPAGSAFSPVSRNDRASQSSAIAVLIKASGGTATQQGTASLSGSGTLSASPMVAGTVGAATVLKGVGVLTAIAGVGAPPPPVDQGPPPPPPPVNTGPTRSFPSAAGVRLFNELAPLNAGDAERGSPLLTFLDSAAGQILQDLDDLVRDTKDGPGWSQVMDPERAPTRALAWLGQFIGVLVDTASADSDQRAQIIAEQGFKRGTKAAILAAAEAHLNPGQTATITERAGGDPYALTVTVSGAQVIGRTYADLAVSYPTYAQLESAYPTYASFAPSADQITAAINAVKPAGLVLTVILA
jgi:hypothetical protein